MEALKQTAQRALVDAAIAVLAENPGASLSEIALAAGVGRATLHRHFRTRGDLMRELALEAIRQTDAASAGIMERAPSGAEGLRDMLEAVIPLGDRFHFIMSESWTGDDPAVAEGYERQLECLRNLVERLKREAAIAPDVSTAWAVSVIDALIWRAWRDVHEGRVARLDAAPLSYRTLLKGLGP